MYFLILRRLSAVIAGFAAALAASVIAPLPAHADVTLGGGGHVWGYQPTATSYTIPRGSNYYYAANDGGGDITVTRTGTGQYLVRWAGLAAAGPAGGGIAHASAYGSSASLCTVAGWWKSGPDVSVWIFCFDRAGTPADSYFTANYASVAGTDKTAAYTYLWADQPTAASYAPHSFYRYDSTGGTPWMYRDGVGSYRAYLPSAAAFADQTTTFYQITAYGAAAVTCRVASYLGGGMVRVYCHNAAGTRVDSRFALTFTPTNLLQRIAPSALARVAADATSARIVWNNESSLSYLRTATRLGTGYYRLYFPQIESPYGHAVARAIGASNTRCHVSSWSRSGSDEYVYVRCFSATTASDAPFVVGFTW